MCRLVAVRFVSVGEEATSFVLHGVRRTGATVWLPYRELLRHNTKPTGTREKKKHSRSLGVLHANSRKSLADLGIVLREARRAELHALRMAGVLFHNVYSAKLIADRDAVRFLKKAGYAVRVQRLLEDEAGSTEGFHAGGRKQGSKHAEAPAVSRPHALGSHVECVGRSLVSSGPVARGEEPAPPLSSQVHHPTSVACPAATVADDGESSGRVHPLSGDLLVVTGGPTADPVPRRTPESPTSPTDWEAAVHWYNARQVSGAPLRGFTSSTKRAPASAVTFAW